MASFPHKLSNKLVQAKEKFLFRSLKTSYPAIDFSSNDYLGFSSKGYLSEELKSMEPSLKMGSTGSRLISGNSSLFKEIEDSIAQFHQSPSALIFNSGYDANLGLLSSVPQKGDLILSDELIHASLIDGIRLSFASYYKFKHNDIASLRELVERHRSSFQEIYVVVESVYSMDGDCAPLIELAAICKQYDLHLIVDEAHAIGVFGDKGKGLCQELAIQDDCFARIYTYGKAMGCHGAAILGSEELKHYLINYSRSFIYTTAMPEHSLLAIKAAYQLLLKTSEIQKLRDTIYYFNKLQHTSSGFIESISAIHCKIVSGNKTIEDLETKLAATDVFVKSIKSPTVKEGQERLRICLHSFNTEYEVGILFNLL
ncbi:MAG: aminotransferase class I/II-fold pyridoxal phosphate-dependent enzyme [Bacteroidetes bacterium]|nr:aminotransferase class I/II-fold pyridoxal phosphate-dependent enzyme [Bacteroidota bacterium]